MPDFICFLISGLGKICRLDNFLRNDIIMWKSARCSIHHFLIQGTVKTRFKKDLNFQIQPRIVCCLVLFRYQFWIQKRLIFIFFLFTAMLLGNDANRKAFATLFTKNFGQMMKEFITDDHEHSGKSLLKIILHLFREFFSTI